MANQKKESKSPLDGPGGVRRPPVPGRAVGFWMLLLLLVFLSLIHISEPTRPY